jgi:hypothetical protein
MATGRLARGGQSAEPAQKGCFHQRLAATTQSCKQPAVVTQPHRRDRRPTARLRQQIFLDHDHVGVVHFGGRRRDERSLLDRRLGVSTGRPGDSAARPKDSPVNGTSAPVFGLMSDS